MTRFICKLCRPEHPCFFDNGENYADEVKPDRCPIEDFEQTKWEVQTKCKYCEGSLKHEPNSNFCGHCGIQFYDED